MAPNSQNSPPVTAMTTLPLIPERLPAPIVTERLILRPLRLADLTAFHGVRSQPEAMAHSRRGRPDADLGETLSKLQRLQAPRRDSHLYFGIFLRRRAHHRRGEVEAEAVRDSVADHPHHGVAKLWAEVDGDSISSGIFSRSNSSSSSSGRSGSDITGISSENGGGGGIVIIEEEEEEDDDDDNDNNNNEVGGAGEDGHDDNEDADDDDDEGELIGDGGVHAFTSEATGWPEFGYKIRKEYWGRGYATEFAHAFMRLWRALPRAHRSIPIARGSLGDGNGDGAVPSPGTVGSVVMVAERICAWTTADNIASQRVLRKIGFELAHGIDNGLVNWRYVC